MSPNLFGKEILTPSSVADSLQGELERRGPVLVEGEVASIYRAASGHLYFNLKDETSQLKAVMWRSQVARGGALQAANGLQVLARGVLGVYRARSEYQMVVDSISPKGEGALRRAYERLLARPSEEGLFAPGRKRAPELPPARVALLTSSGSAAANDFLETAVKRSRDLHVSLYHVTVQGAGAAEEMASALADVNRWGLFDLAVLTRGGGSLEDLWAFNEEVLVRAVAASRIPVMAAIGHSTDLSLVEMAADLRAITPTAAAESLWPSDSERLERLSLAKAALIRAAREALRGRREDLASATSRLAAFKSSIMALAQTADSLALRLRLAAKGALERGQARLGWLARALRLQSPALEAERRRARLKELSERLHASARQALALKKAAAGEAAARLALVSPKRVLARGYAIVTGPDGRVVSRASAAAVGQPLRLTLAEGALAAEVTGILDG
jgi:exodeoxyribonuclease VII large subunit